MGKTRLDLQKIFEGFLNSRNVYFNPPETVKMNYPCILFKLDALSTKHADNIPYHIENHYNVTLVERSPMSSRVQEMLLLLPKMSFDRSYVSDGLYHYVYTLYF